MTLYQRYKRLSFWNKLGAIASITGILAFIIAVITLPIFERAKQRPHFILSLQIGDAVEYKVFLTNGFLFSGRFINAGNFPDGSFSFQGIPDGCIVIPVQSGESNNVFNFTVENDSPIKVNDLEIAVGFPKGYEIGLDPTKWRELGQHVIIPGKWRLDMTNLQCWSAQSPYALFPSDSLTFPPITNLSIPEFNNPSNKNSLLDLSLRCTDYQSMILANIMFVRVPSNSFKPFVAKMKLGADGFRRVSISPKELEDSQK